RFREDLYYRLTVVTLKVPPLRERREDIRLLVAPSLKRTRDFGAKALTVSEEVLVLLEQYCWPGKVRELENTIENAPLYAERGTINPDDLPAKIRDYTRTAEIEARINTMFEDLPSLDELERRYLLHVLASVGGSRTRAAEVLGIDRRTLYRMAERHGIKLKEATD